MRVLRIPSLVLSVLLQCLPLARAVTADAMAVASPMVALLRCWVGTAAVAGSFHAVSGASISLTSPSEGRVLATNGVDFAFRVSMTYTSGGKTLSPGFYEAGNLPPGFNQPTKSGAIWRVTGRPTQSGVFSNVRLTGYEDPNREGDHFASVFLTITVVDAAPSITVHPQNLTVTAGSPASLSVTATGSSLNYQWLKGDLEIPNATNATLSFATVTPVDAGTYRVRIQYGGGIRVSDGAVLTVNPGSQAPTFTITPQGTNVHAGETVVLASAATGDGNLTYVWARDGENLYGQTNPSLTLAGIQAEDAGDYTVRVTGTGGTTTSPAATITVASPLTLQIPGLSGQGLTLPFNGIARRTYVLEALNPANGWDALQEAAGGASAQFLLPGLEATTQLLRVRTK